MIKIAPLWQNATVFRGRLARDWPRLSPPHILTLIGSGEAGRLFCYVVAAVRAQAITERRTLNRCIILAIWLICRT